MSRITDFNKTDFEENPYDFMTYMLYKGKPFTGTLRDGNQTIEFRNGDAHGERIIYYDNGLIAEHSFYENGDCVNGKRWYENGELQFADGFYYSPEGKVLRINGNWVYPNGAKMSDRDAEGMFCEYAPDGNLAIRVLSHIGPRSKNEVIYFDGIMSEWYPELLINYHEGRDSLFDNRELLIWYWAMITYAKDEEKGKTIIQTMIDHPNHSISRTASEWLRDTTNKTEDAKGYRNGIFQIRLA